MDAHDIARPFLDTLGDPVPHAGAASLLSLHLAAPLHATVTGVLRSCCASSVHVSVDDDVDAELRAMEDGVRQRLDESRRTHSCLTPGGALKVRCGAEFAVADADSGAAAELVPGMRVAVDVVFPGAWADATWCGVVVNGARARVLERPAPAEGATEPTATSTTLPPVFRRPDLVPPEEADDALTEMDGGFETEVCLGRLQRAMGATS